MQMRDSELQRGNKKIIVIAAIVLAMVVLFAVGGTAYLLYAYDGTYFGLTVDGVKFGGITRMEAARRLGDVQTSPLDILLAYDGNERRIGAADAGVGIDVEKTVDRLYSYGRQGAFTDRISTIAQGLSGVEIQPAYRFDEGSLKRELEQFAQEAGHGAVETAFELQEGSRQVKLTLGQRDNVLSIDDLFNAVGQKITMGDFTRLDIDKLEETMPDIDYDTIAAEISRPAKDAYFRSEEKRASDVEPHVVGIELTGGALRAAAENKRPGEEIVVPVRVIEPAVTTDVLMQEASLDILSQVKTYLDPGYVTRTKI